MSGDKHKKLKSGTKGTTTEKKIETSSSSASLTSLNANHEVEDGANVSPVATDIRTVVSEIMTKGLDDLKMQMAKDLSDFREMIKNDIKSQLDELSTNIDQKLQAAASQIEEATRRLEEVEKNAAGAEKFDLAVRDVLLELLSNQRDLQSKMSDLEGRSRRNNVRIYGVPENAEGTSMPRFVENLLMTELATTRCTPRSTVIRFLRHTTKEKVLQAAWKKPMYVQNKRVFFDHDYATEVQQKRKDYAPIKKVLKENQIQFQTPLTKMRIHFDTGAVTFSDPSAAAAELEKRGFSVGPVRVRKSAEHNAETLAKLLPWRTAGTRRIGTGLPGEHKRKTPRISNAQPEDTS
ncbi:hypothetical protein WMY93_003631 [Mugilogobius chulae]|uniref:L1 transposable element RRM domain-containing protein n=1 Tax=Mugilogobius chulae TaxID=88201 RepID=A0AAW0PYS3_9GOBI